MSGSQVFLAGTTGTTLVRGIYAPGSQGVMNAWASNAGLLVSKEGGLQSVLLRPEASLGDATSSIRVVRSILAKAPCPAELLGMRPELVVGSATHRVQSGEVATRLWSTQLPSGAFLPLAPDLWVATPAFLFAQQATDLGLVAAVSYGNELCGHYSLDGSARGFDDHEPFVSTYRLRSFLAECKRAKGARVARIALKWVRDGFRSPKESDTYLLTCLPRDYGGYGIFRQPEVNGRIEVPPELWHLSDACSYEVDLIWRREGAVVEYDGRDHDSPEQRLRDDMKTHVLERMGYLVIRIGWDILRDPREFDRRMRLLAERIGVAIPPTTSEFERTRRKLRRELFGA